MCLVLLAADVRVQINSTPEPSSQLLSGTASVRYAEREASPHLCPKACANSEYCFWTNRRVLRKRWDLVSSCIGTVD